MTVRNNNQNLKNYTNDPPMIHYGRHRRVALHTPPQPWFQVIGLLLALVLGWILHSSVDLTLDCYHSNVIISSYGAPHKNNNIKNSPARLIKTELREFATKRPNWRTDYSLKEWLPHLAGRWIHQDRANAWNARLEDHDLVQQLYYDDFHKSSNENSNDKNRTNKLRIDAFWKMASPRFSVAIAKNGVGHRLAHLSYSYMCNIVPNRLQQFVHWEVPSVGGDNRAWQYLFDDSPAIMGLPYHLRQRGQHIEVVNFAKNYRQSVGKEESECSNGDWDQYFRFDCGLNQKKFCNGFRHPKDLWLLRFAKEPSVQEFYMMLRAQLKQRIKNKLANFVERNFHPDKLIIGVHLRGGNGRDDGQGHFDKVQRGDWLVDLPAAIKMVRKQIRMIAYSMLDRMNIGDNGNFTLSNDEYDEIVDEKYIIFLATDTSAIIEEFKHQDSTIITLDQARIKEGQGITANAASLPCVNITDPVECSLRTQEAMMLDMMAMSSCDAMFATTFSNFMYSLPVSLAMAEGRVFCESGRAALGGKYTLNARAETDNTLGNSDWWVHPPPNTMPVRCQQGAWAARDRTNLHSVPDVGT